MSDPLTPGTSPDPRDLPPSAPRDAQRPGWERDTMERLMFATLAEQR